MLRTQVYLAEEEKVGLNHLVESTGASQSELIREAMGMADARIGATSQLNG